MDSRVNRWESTSAKEPNRQPSGLYRGSGGRKTGARAPNAIAMITKNGTTKNARSQTVAGAANAGQNHRGREPPRPGALGTPGDLLVDLLVQLVDGRLQLALRDAERYRLRPADGVG